MIVTTKKLFEAAYGKYAIGAYNINNLEQTVGLFRGNLSQAPFIIQISKGARSYSDKVLLEGLIRSADEVFPEAIFAVHLDHGDEETAMDCIESGFYSSVMIDASHEDFDTNIAITRAWWMQPMPGASWWKLNWASWAVWKNTSRWMKPMPS
jgi:fructose-bisphosphate aldolase, class II